MTLSSKNIVRSTILPNLLTWYKQSRRMQPFATHSTWHSSSSATLMAPASLKLRCCANSLTFKGSRHRQSSGISKPTASRPTLRAFSSEADSETQYGQPWSIYDNPILYDSAFSYERDFKADVDFLEAVFKEHSGAAATSFLDIGCGPANHAVELAKRGHRVLALDSNEHMLEYATRKAAEAGATVEFLEKDMEEYTLPNEEQVDVAFIALNGMSHLHSNYDARDCWESTMAALKPGGLLILETDLINTIFDGSFIEGSVWEAPIIGAKEALVIMEYGTDDDTFDPESQVLRRRIGVSVRQGEQIDLQGEAYVWQRLYTFQELSLLAELTGLEVVATYGHMSVDIPLGHRQQRSLVMCLAKAANQSDTEMELGE